MRQPGEGRVLDGAPGFEAWAREAHRSLLHLAWLLTGDRGRAEDLVQETVWRTFRAWNRIEAHEAAGAYARTTMVRLAQRWRRRRWRGEHPTAVADLDRPSATSATTQVDDALVLGRALAELSPEQRVVLVLRYFEARSEAEIAQMLGCAEGTVKSRAARGLAALRTHPLLADLDEPTGRPNR
jgi:RNA polymerase sigma-70 factor (sigma-E family)